MNRQDAKSAKVRQRIELFGLMKLWGALIGSLCGLIRARGVVMGTLLGLMECWSALMGGLLGLTRLRGMLTKSSFRLIER